MKNLFITGGAGFIGSNLVDSLLLNKNIEKITVYDSLVTGRKEFLVNALKDERVNFIEGNILNKDHLSEAIKNHDFVFHLAANADVRFGWEHPSKDLEVNTIGTFNILEAMRSHDVQKICFASTGSIYGEASIFPTPENHPIPSQTSLYGASKISAESLISAYTEGCDMQAWVFRFVSVMGARYTHGHLFDFYKKLKQNPSELKILGDGSQNKSYIHIDDLISGMIISINSFDHQFNVINLGTDETMTVLKSIETISGAMNVNPVIIKENKERGWIGDNPYILLDIKKLQSTSWKQSISIQEAIKLTIDWFDDNPWVFES